MSEYNRLQNNLNILSIHNTTNKSVLHLTGFTKTENEIIKEIVSDTQKMIDKIENGTLIELPCKVGDTIWTINCWQEYGKKELGESYIVTRYELHENKCSCVEINDKSHHRGEVSILAKERYKGVTPYVFLTKAEAEKRLKELQGAVHT